MNNRRYKSKTINLKYSGIRRSNIRKLPTVPLDSSNLNENKEKMINDSIECVQNEIPKTLIQINEFYNEIIKFIDDNYDKQLTKNDYENIRNKLQNKLEKLWPFECEQQQQQQQSESKQVSNKTLSCAEKRHPYSQCVRHVNNLHHHCYNRYSFWETINIVPEILSNTTISNEYIVRFSEKFRSIIVDLTEKLLKINIGFSFLVPKTEDNEDNDISIKVLDKVLALTSFECSIGNVHIEQNFIYSFLLTFFFLFFQRF